MDNLVKITMIGWNVTFSEQHEEIFVLRIGDAWLLFVRLDGWAFVAFLARSILLLG